MKIYRIITIVIIVKKKERATKSQIISKAPKILLIHLKRFKLLPKRRIKINETIDFPIHKFNLSPFFNY